jgi:hypothetical protein
MAGSDEGKNAEGTVSTTDDCERQFQETHRYARRAFVIAIAAGIVAILSLLIAVVSLLTMLSFAND